MLIEWLPGSNVGRVPTTKVIKVYRQCDGAVPDADYLSELEKCHGAVPLSPFFKDKARSRHKVGRFINFLDRSTIRGPLQPSFIDPRSDQRLWWSFNGLMSLENIRGGTGDRLIPFALLCSGEHHSDEMDPTHSHLLCFNYSKGKESVPSVVYWDNDLAVEEYYRCEDAGEAPYSSMKLDAFTVPVAKSFREFASLLKAR